MRIRIHLSTCSGDEDRTVLDLQIGSGKLDWQTSLPWGVLFSMSEESGGAVLKSIWCDWHCHIGIGSTLPTRHSTTRCRAYPVTENCRSDLSLTNGNLVNEISRQDARNDKILCFHVYFWYFWIWCSFLWKKNHGNNLGLQSDWNCTLGPWVSWSKVCPLVEPGYRAPTSEVKMVKWNDRVNLEDGISDKSFFVSFKDSLKVQSSS